MKELPLKCLIQVLPDPQQLIRRSLGTERSQLRVLSNEIVRNKLSAAWEQIVTEGVKPREMKIQLVGDASASASHVRFVNRARDNDGRFRKRRGKVGGVSPKQKRSGEDIWEEDTVTVEKVNVMSYMSILKVTVD